MSVTVELLPDAPILIATFGEPFDAQKDVRGMFSAFFPMRLNIKGALVLILDLQVTANHPHEFSQMVIGLGEAVTQIKANKANPNISAPHLIFVGVGDVITLAATAMEQEQYGGIKVRACAFCDAAIALARTLLSE